ncbi:uncharacterized protein N7483_000169 [Penicillium malachiteum]|uniref:uncharacterized protein n=1 Tax=Penicillium malachiteum TaxID=1324776 RepID=UPI002546F346|nr:uncharacterized protein N7483_000169 [Penicillium malachiteum]KAJ5735044.1 hypothetical protein N7483_000169 [Penicillium malachiteum]
MPYKARAPSKADPSASYLLLIYQDGWDDVKLKNFPGVPIADPTVFDFLGPQEITVELAVALATDIADNSWGSWTAFEGYKLCASLNTAPRTWYVILKKNNGPDVARVADTETETESIWGNAFAKGRASTWSRESDDNATAIHCSRDDSPAENDWNDGWNVNHVENTERRHSSGSNGSSGEWATGGNSWSYNPSPQGSESNYSATNDDGQNAPVSIAKW